MGITQSGHPVPTGEQHEFGVEEMFFSTTDSKGVITGANDVFVHISRYSEDRLLGAPHNILRHPGMPAAAFKLMWDELQAGRMFGTYVRNLAADGGTYDVFATAVPVGTSYLSVRTRPLRQDLRELVHEQYARTLAAESAAPEGTSRRQTAELGAADLLQRITALGFRDLQDFCTQLMIAEVQQHATASSLLPARPEATGTVAHLLNATRSVEAQVSQLMHRLDEYGTLVTRLRSANDDVAPTVQRVRDLLEAVRRGTQVLAPEGEGTAAASADVDEETKGLQDTLRNLRERIEDRVATAVAGYDGLPERVDELAAGLDSMRARIALLRLHNAMVGRLTLELLDGSSTQAHSAVPLLCDALTQGARETSEQITRVRELAAAIPAVLSTAVSGVDRSRRQLNKWAGTTERFPDAQAVASEREYVETQAQAGFDELNELTAVAVRCSFFDVPFDQHAMDASIAGIRAALEDMPQE